MNELLLLWNGALIPFWVSILGVLALALIEGASLALAGGSASSAVESAIDLNVNHDFGHAEMGAVAGAFEWLHIGKVPFIMILGLLLAGFGVSGLIIQSISMSALGAYLPLWAAVPLGIVGALGTTRKVGGFFAKLLGDSAKNVNQKEFLGLTGVVVECAEEGARSAQVRITDSQGGAQYVIVKLSDSEPDFKKGQSIVLTEQTGLSTYSGRQINSIHEEVLKVK